MSSPKTNKDTGKEATKEASKSSGKDSSKDGAKGTSKDSSKDPSKDVSKDAAKDNTKDDGGDAGTLKDKLNNLKEKMANNAANINEQMTKNAAQLRERINNGDSSDSDEDSSDEEAEETLFGDSTTAGTSTVAATAITVRNQMPPSFISLEDEEEIKNQLKAAKTLRKRLRKLKKLSTSSLKHTQEAVDRMDKLLVGVNAATEGPCTDAGIQKLAATSAENMKTFRESDNYETYKSRVMAETDEMMKPLMDHAKYLSIVGKERRQARDKRIQLEREAIDVSDEAAYLRSVEVVKEYDEKNMAYKDEFRSLVEHNSSHVGLMLKSVLLESAIYYEALASALRASASSVATTSNQYMTEAAAAKFKDYVAPKVESAITAPALFSMGNRNGAGGGGASEETDDRLTTKPTARMRDEVVTGIPLTETGADRQQPDSTYGTSAYTRHAAGTPESTNVSRTRRAVDNFLKTGQVPGSPTATATRNDNATAPAAAMTDSMKDIRYLEEMYGVAWPGSASDDDEKEGANMVSTRSMTPTDASILPTIFRNNPHYYGSGMM